MLVLETALAVSRVAPGTVMAQEDLVMETVLEQTASAAGLVPALEAETQTKEDSALEQQAPRQASRVPSLEASAAQGSGYRAHQTGFAHGTDSMVSPAPAEPLHQEGAAKGAASAT
jgi:hypothetical protein